MTITTRDQLIDGMGNNSSRIIIDKAALSNTAAGFLHSYWRSAGQPALGAIPAAAAVCNNTTAGAMGFTQQTAPATSYIGLLEASVSVGPQTVEIHDRLVHMGGLSGIVTTAQTVGIDLLSLLSTSNLSERIGATDYSDVQWWLEWYTNTGTTSANATINVTYDDGTTGNLNLVTLGATVTVGRMISLNALIPAGKFIRGVNSVTLSVSTGTAGSFGVTATRYRAAQFCPISNARFTAAWAETGLPNVPNSACLVPMMYAGVSSTAAIRTTGKIVHG